MLAAFHRSFAMAARALRLANGELTEPYDGSCGVGKWDRFMTPGPKIQNGVDFDFNEPNLKQCVQNFARVYSMRRLPLDFRHLAAVAAEDVQTPEQSLAYYNALCVVWDGKVVEFWGQDPATTPPDVSTLLLELRAKFPRVTSADGLWGLKCEVTPLGLEKLPNMEQLSPLFSKDDVDELGNPIGYNVLNCSAVNVAFQNGTLINLGHAMPAAFSKGNHMAENQIPEHLMEKLKKHGMGDEMEPASMMAAYHAYMSDTEDPPAMRGEMKSCMAARMAKMSADLDAEGSKTNPPVELGKEGEEESSSDKAAKMSKKIAANPNADPEVQRLIGKLTDGHAAMSKELTALRRDKQATEFAKKPEIAKRVDEETAREYLVSTGWDEGKARNLILKMPEKTALGRMTSAGAPIGKDPKAMPTEAEVAPLVNGGRHQLHGYALSKAAAAHAEKMTAKPGETAFEKHARAQREVLKARPDLHA